MIVTSERRTYAWEQTRSIWWLLTADARIAQHPSLLHPLAGDLRPACRAMLPSDRAFVVVLADQAGERRKPKPGRRM